MKLGTGFTGDTARVRFFTADGQVDTDAKQETRILADATVVMKLQVSDSGPKNAAGLPGVVEISAGEVMESVEVFPKY
jgi:hypothetical protein